LHVGHARTFLLAWWSVRARGGRIVLRIEDLDRARSRPELAAACLADLEWLGLDWDEGPLYQSADLARYERACAELLERGAAYPCVCSRAEIALASAPHAGDDEPRYPGTCRGRWRSAQAAESATGRPAGLRLAIPAEPLSVRDEIHGERTFDVQAEVGDLLLRRRDGVFSYQLAVVVDDAQSGITEVLRGDDLLPSAARQAWIQRHLAFPHPTWIHVPLVVHPGGVRLAKRNSDLSLAALRASGADPRRIIAWAARSIGLALEPCTARELLPAFTRASIPATPCILEPDAFAPRRA
jgi:glutamyl-tRNA synthetase